jgi:hypothetical protein
LVADFVEVEIRRELVEAEQRVLRGFQGGIEGVVGMIEATGIIVQGAEGLQIAERDGQDSRARLDLPVGLRWQEQQSTGWQLKVQNMWSQLNGEDIGNATYDEFQSRYTPNRNPIAGNLDEDAQTVASLPALERHNPASSESTNIDIDTLPTNPRTVAQARLALLSTHLSHSSPIPLPVINCTRPGCTTLLTRLMANHPSNAKIRCCVHERCGFVSQTKEQWNRHILKEHHVQRRTFDRDWGEGGMCCA